MKFLLFLSPAFVVLAIAGVKLSLATIRRLGVLIKEMQERGYPVDRAQAGELYRRWDKDPQSIVNEFDPEELKAIKRAHAAAFLEHAGPWRKVVKYGPTALGIAGAILFFIVGA
jgi:hypothetical protein